MARTNARNGGVTGTLNVLSMLDRLFDPRLAAFAASSYAPRVQTSRGELVDQLAAKLMSGELLREIEVVSGR